MDELVERAQRGDRVALEQLLSSLAPAIHRFGLRMCKNAHDADDVLQDTLLNVAQHIAQFEGRSSLPSWVFALTRSACHRRQRGLKNARQEGEERISEHASAEPSPEALLAEQELSRLLLCALDQLPEPQREVILLRDVEGLSAPETASALEISIDAVKSRLHRAREALRERMRPLYASPARATACPDVMLLWSQMLEGDLSQSDCAAMEQHLEGCAACRATCDGLKSALRVCRSLPSAPVPSNLQERIRAALRASDGAGA